MNYLNQELIEIGKEVLTKEDRLLIFDRCRFHKQSSVYAALQGKRKISNEDAAIIQSIIRKAYARSVPQ
jgi:hypothetical protein